LSPNESYPQHVVTAVIVAHDGAAWLPHVADAVLGQTRPVQRVVAVDTGSRDRSGAVLGSKFGRTAAFGMERSTGYGAAIARALQHRAANMPVPSPPGAQGAERIEWLWLLHDDCEPAPDALEQLLRGTVETTSAAVLGPKLRDWSQREVILEAGVTLDTATRRVTGIEPREVDQGQHDGDRDVLAVSSAGMLVRRDIWDHVGGFDTGMGLFMEDIDFCWRVHAAGYRVRVITDAIAYHAQASARHRRAVSVGRRTRMLDRRNGLLTLLGNLPFRPMLTAAAGNVLVSLLRITFFLLAKRLAAAMDELSAIIAVLCHPLRLIRMRGQRSRGRRAAYSRVRADLPPGHSARRLTEFAISTLSKSQPDATGAHHASADPAEDDSMLVDNGLGKLLLTSPSLLTFVALLAVALAAGHSLIGPGPLGGGSLVPSWGGASDLWSAYLQAFHPTGIGSAAAAPPWLAVIAALATVLAGKAWLAIDVLMVGCVPLAGMTAMLAARKVTTSAPVRVWASVTYALLPVATGVVASARFGTAVAFILLPLILAQAGRMVTASGPRATRAAWATGLLVAIGAAFVPLLWIMTVVACLLAAIVFRATRRGLLRNLAIATLMAPVLLLPWSLTQFAHPAGTLLEAGLPQPGTPVGGLPARALMLLSPGGPGLPPYWVTAGLLAVALAALFVGRRRKLVMAGWGIALSGLLTAIVASHLTVRPGEGGPVVVWTGLPLALAALGLLLASAAGAGALGRLLAGVKGWRAVVSGRGPWAALVALIACSTPVIAAAAWLGAGVSGPIHPVHSTVVPELVAAAEGQSRQVRTLVLRSSGGRISYLLLSGPSPSLADTALTPPPDALHALSKAVSTLTTPGGGLAADQARLLADFDIGYVLVQAPVDKRLANVLGNVSGLRPYSITSGYSLWQLDSPPARLTVTEPDGTVVAIPSGRVGVSAAPAPTAGGTLMLSEPAGGWSASLDGHPLAEVPSPAGGWAQAFRLPRGGGSLSVGHSGFARELMLVFELLAFVVAVGLALPGIKVAEQEALSAGAADADRPGTAGSGLTGAGLAGAGGEVAGGEVAGGYMAGGEVAAGAAPEGRAGLAGGVLAGRQARSPRYARGARSRARRGRAAARGKVGRAGRSRAGQEAAAGGRSGASPAGLDEAAAAAGTAAGSRARPGSRRRADDAAGRREARQREAGLADAWPYAAGRDDPGDDTRLADAWPYPGRDDPAGDTRLADAWPYAAEEPRPGSRADAPRSDLRPPAGGDPAQTGPRPGRPAGPQEQAWSYSDEPDHDLGARADFSATGPSGRPYDDGYPEPSAGRHSAAAGRSPSGRSASGDWPYPDSGAGPRRDRGPAAGRSPSGRSPAGSWPDPGVETADRRLSSGRSAAGRSPERDWPARDLADRDLADRDLADRDLADRDRQAWGDDQSTQDRRTDEPSTSGSWPYGEPDRGRRSTRSGRPDTEPDQDPADRGPREPRRGRRGIGRSARHGGGRPGRDRTREEPPARPGGGEALEPLPPIGGPGRRQSGRSAWRPAEDTGERVRGRDEERQDQRWSEPLPDYEPEYEGDGW